MISFKEVSRAHDASQALRMTEEEHAAMLESISSEIRLTSEEVCRVRERVLKTVSPTLPKIRITLNKNKTPVLWNGQKPTRRKNYFTDIDAKRAGVTLPTKPVMPSIHEQLKKSINASPYKEEAEKIVKSWDKASQYQMKEELLQMLDSGQCTPNENE